MYEPFEYVPYESEREIIAERLAEMGLKQINIDPYTRSVYGQIAG